MQVVEEVRLLVGQLIQQEQQVQEELGVVETELMMVVQEQQEQLILVVAVVEVEFLDHLLLLVMAEQVVQESY